MDKWRVSMFTPACTRVNTTQYDNWSSCLMLEGWRFTQVQNLIRFHFNIILEISSFSQHLNFFSSTCTVTKKTKKTILVLSSICFLKSGPNPLPKSFRTLFFLLSLAYFYFLLCASNPWHLLDVGNWSSWRGPQKRINKVYLVSSHLISHLTIFFLLFLSADF